jgi:hypothetical protein
MCLLLLLLSGHFTTNCWQISTSRLGCLHQELVTNNVNEHNVDGFYVVFFLTSPLPLGYETRD